MAPPPVLVNVDCVAAVDELSVTTLPTVPVIVQLATVVVPLAGRVIVWASVLVEAKVLNVLLPVNVVVELPVAPPIVKLL